MRAAEFCSAYEDYLRGIIYSSFCKCLGVKYSFNTSNLWIGSLIIWMFWGVYVSAKHPEKYNGCDTKNKIK